MYKKAARLKLRVQTKYGPLAVEQLWDLKLSDLSAIIKNLFEEKKKHSTHDEELAFLDGPVAESKEGELVNLQYDIVKDIYLTKQGESKEALAKAEKRKEANRIAELIAKKRDAELEGLSIEELEKKLKELGD